MENRRAGQGSCNLKTKQKKSFSTSKSNIDLISCIGFSFILPEDESCIKGGADERFWGAHTVKFRLFFLMFYTRINWNGISFNSCSLLSLLLDLWCSFEMFQWLKRWCYPPTPPQQMFLHICCTKAASPQFAARLLTHFYLCKLRLIPLERNDDNGVTASVPGLPRSQGCLGPRAASVPGLLQSWLYIPNMWVTQKWLSITIHDSSDLFVVEYVKKDEQVLVFSLIYASYNTLT